MSFRNEHPYEDFRNVTSGKNGAIYNGNGKLLASVASFSAKESVTTQVYNPIGSMQEMDVPVSFKVSITLEEFVVKDSDFISDIYEMNENGTIPDWNLQGSIEGRNGEQRIAYPHCVPSGDIDLQNIVIGDLLKRSFAITCNGRPRPLGRL